MNIKDVDFDRQNANKLVDALLENLSFKFTTPPKEELDLF
jgi:hypothetical protein